MKTALLQLNVSDDPVANLSGTLDMLQKAVSGGAEFVLTPEVTNCVSTSRSHQRAVLAHEEDDITLDALRDAAAEAGIWLLIGSLALKTTDADGRFANRSFLISPAGEIVARYDKIHMFDVDLDNGESWRESAVYQPGEIARTVDLDGARLGMGICYDIRFPHLFRDLALAGADILTAPAAFTRQTGEAHWHVLQRARAIENGAFVISAAQGGVHEDGRETYGHSLIVDPWGRVIAEAKGDEPGVIVASLALDEVKAARGKVPNLKNARSYRIGSGLQPASGQTTTEKETGESVA